MSATVYWEVIGTEKPSFDVSAPSAFGELLSKRCGGEPWDLETSDLEWLEGVADADARAPCADWQEIIAAVRTHKRIRIWRVY